MQTEQKNKIVEAAALWMTGNSFTKNDLARHSKINAGYLSNMLRNQYSTEVQGKEVMITDKWFYILAQSIGFAVKKQYWATIQTKEFEKMIHELRTAKNDSRTVVIVNDTGLGKTFTVEKFMQVHPQHTYKITVNSLYKVRDILQQIAEPLGTPVRCYPIDSLAAISKRLKDLKMMGHSPTIIIDEAENLKLPVIQMLKGLYDSLNGYASIVLIGTTQLLDSLERMKKSNRSGAPQFYRRIKAGIKIIPVYNDFKPFFEKFKIEDKGLRKLLNEICSNYGELHDYLEPVLRDADETEQALTETYFRTYHNLPSY